MPSIKTETLPASMRSIELKPLFNIFFAVKPPIQFGSVPDGERQTGFILGGEFEGERLRGRVHGGSDWQVIRSDSATSINVRVALETHDGALIGMFYTGLRHGPSEIIEALDAGETVDPSKYYFRVNGAFQTSSPQYAWLNGIIAIGTGSRLGEGPIYRWFEVL